MKTGALVSMLLLAMASLGQEIPAGTILPVQLNSSLRSNKLRSGESISGRVMQNVPLPSNSKLRAGSKVVGRVVAVTPASATSQAEIALRFDTVVTGKQHIPIATNLRAIATMMDVAEARVPESGPDRGTPEYYWTTDQIGGEAVYHGGGAVTHGSYVVGKSVGDGVLVRVSAAAGTKCRGEVADNDRPQALWVFSSDACGVYDIPSLAILHAGRTDPRGEIRLGSSAGDVNIRGGSGLLLRVE